MIGPLKTRVALVTGASGGIGRAIATALGSAGATVCLVGRDRGALEATAARSGGCAAVFPADLTRDRDIAALAERIRRGVDRLDVLVHAAGILVESSAADGDVKDLDSQYRVNVRAPWALTQALLPELRTSRGHVVFVHGREGRQARAGESQYAATQHALRAVAGALREEVGPDGIRVLSIEAGPTATPMRELLHARHGRAVPEPLLQPDAVAAVVVHALTLPPAVEITELALRAAPRPRCPGY